MNKLLEAAILQNIINKLTVTTKQPDEEYEKFRYQVCNCVVIRKIIKTTDKIRLCYFETVNGYFEVLQNLENNENYIFDNICGNIYQFQIDGSHVDGVIDGVTSMKRSRIIGSVSDIGTASKLGLLTDFIGEYVTVEFLEGNNFIGEWEWEDKAKQVLYTLSTSFKNNWDSDTMALKKEALLNPESVEPFTPFTPFERVTQFGIPCAKDFSSYIPDNFKIFFESTIKGFDVSIYEFSFDFDNNPNHFNGEGYLIQIDSILYCFDLETEHFWVNRDTKNIFGYEKFVTNLDVTLFIRLFNKLEDLVESAISEDEENIKKYILTLIYLLEIDLEIDSEIVSGNILDTVINIEEIIKVTAGETGEDNV